MAKVFHRLMKVDEAVELVKRHLKSLSLELEYVALTEALGRILAETVVSPIDYPPFDRATVDGYAVNSTSLLNADEENPVKLRVVGEVKVGELPGLEVKPGEATEIHTGAPIPKGADSVVMSEYTKRVGDYVFIYRSTYPGENIAQTGVDLMVGETLLRKGVVLTSREISVLAAIGLDKIPVYRRVKIAVISTGCEVQPPGSPLKPGRIYDVNSSTISCMLRELGCQPDILGIYPDDFDVLREVVGKALENYDVVISSGSTSAGFGDVIYRVFNSLGKPGVLVHGLLMRPGKPTVAAVINGKFALGLPGFPVSAMIAFHMFARPIIAHLIGLPIESPLKIRASLPFRVKTGGGVKTIIPVSLTSNHFGFFSAYPIVEESGAIWRLALSDGFIECPEERDFLDEDEEVYVTLFSKSIKPADLVFIGSHCLGLDILFECFREPLTMKMVNIGSMGGLLAVKRGEADVAGIHLLDPETMQYNIPYIRKYGLEGRVVLVRGYARTQGFIVKPGNPKKICGFKDFFREDVTIINRNKGSGTRALIDEGLRKASESLGLKFEEAVKRIRGYTFEAKTHSAVASAVTHGKCDVGVGIEAAAYACGLEFIPIAEESYDFLILSDRLQKKPVQLFIEILGSDMFKRVLMERLRGYRSLKETGSVVYR
ncbi:molybdopterin biosynthesis protein [Candidatus Bathyarchaeota archaeon]|nr:molybdopterin biosynthesis protein [Candidatus Bathyarchaeota archaeon]MBS7618033.1 molybdopterin biosynthesis protein [Candidatus Bathyarchaeota archaeon]